MVNYIYVWNGLWLGKSPEWYHAALKTQPNTPLKLQSVSPGNAYTPHIETASATRSKEEVV